MRAKIRRNSRESVARSAVPHALLPFLDVSYSIGSVIMTIAVKKGGREALKGVFRAGWQLRRPLRQLIKLEEPSNLKDIRTSWEAEKGNKRK